MCVNVNVSGTYTFSVLFLKRKFPSQPVVFVLITMDTILECIFEQVLTRLDRGCLMARYKRRQLTDYLGTVIMGSSADDPQEGCRRAVNAALRLHRTSRQDNGQICLLGKYHNVLYVATTLCFEWELEDTSLVEQLLRDIFACEKTFERLFAGAIMGTKVTHLISGWKSDFQSREECVRAVRYYLEHASKVNLSFDYPGGESRRFVDIPMDSYGRVTPLRLAVQAGLSDVVALFLYYGAVISPSPLSIDTCAIQHLLHKMNNFCNERPDDSIPLEYVCCLNQLLKELPMMPRLLPVPDDDAPQAEPEDEEKAPDFHPRMYSFVQPELSGYVFITRTVSFMLHNTDT